MDSREKGFELDLESGGSASEEDGSLELVPSKGPTKMFLGSVLGGVLCSNESIMRTSGIESSCCSENSSEVMNDSARLLIQSNSAGEESQGNTTLDSDRRRKTNSRNAPKPPRPPKGPSLDAADQKLVKEITERVRSKRARIKQLKVAKKLKASNSSSLHSGISAMIITLLFFFVVIIQGISSKSVPNMSIQGSPEPAVATTLGLFTAEYYKSSIPSSTYKSLTEDQVSGSGRGARMRKLMVNMKDS